MQPDQSAGLFPTLPIIEEELKILGLPVTGHVRNEDKAYSGFRRYRGKPLCPEYLYLLTPETARSFPVDQVPYISLGAVPGKAEHLSCPAEDGAALEEGLQDLFDRLQEYANRINALIYRESSLDALCALGETLLGNPLFLHDKWFLIIGRSPSSDIVMPRTGRIWETVPQVLLDEFRADVEYEKTYQHRRAALWESFSNGVRRETIYVNIYDADVYQGRLLLSQELSPLRKRDYLVMELLGRQALVLIKAKRGRRPPGTRSTDDILWDILCGKRTKTAEFSVFLSTLHWEKTDRFLCVRLQRQESIKADAMEAVLHRELLMALPGSYVMVISGQQCVIVNLTRTPLSLGKIHHLLSPLCRDYYQYGGISSPVASMRDLPVAYVQAGEALDRAFLWRDQRWLVYFRDCALEYILMHLNTPMQFRHLVSPQLLALKDYDREKDSQLFDTLQAYLENERDIPKTAARLIIHRTTLTYRLKKIQSLIELDLNDPDVRLYLLLSLEMLKLEKTAALSENAAEDASGDKKAPPSLEEKGEK